MTKKVGRNDPCPCGSGTKYKYCCLKKDQKESHSSPQSQTTASPSPTAARSSPSSSSSLSGTAEPDASSSSPEVEAWDAFHDADYEGRRAVVEEIIGDPERMDGENAFEMFNRLQEDVNEHGDSDWLVQMIGRLREEQPDVYAEELPYLLNWEIEFGSRTDRLGEIVAARVDELARLATADIDQFHPTAELLVYFGHVGPVARAMQDAWEDVYQDSGIMPFGKDEFGDRAVVYTLLAHYERTGDLDLADPDLRSKLDAIDKADEGNVDKDVLTRFAEGLTDPNDQPWQGSNDVGQNVTALTLDFMRTLHEETDVPLGRIHLAREAIESCYAQKHKEDAPPDIHSLLVLEQRDVYRQMKATSRFMSSHPHRKAAFYVLLPRWIEFLADRQLVEPDDASYMHAQLGAIRDWVVDKLYPFHEDETLLRDIDTAWS